jgi:tetratricopeptide (TPR) repeat protein
MSTALVLFLALLAPVPAPVPALAPAGDPGVVAADRPLPGAAQRLVDEGRTLDAWQLLAERIADGLLPTTDARAAAELELSVLLWGALTRELDAWPEALAALDAMSGAQGAAGAAGGGLGAAPADAAFRLAHLRAEALRAVGRAAEARAAADALGLVADVLVIGPFDNERGGGFDVPQPPESAVDVDAPLPGKEREVRWRGNPAREHPLRRLLLHEMLRPNSQALGYVATAVHSDVARDVVLRLGSSGPFKVQWNGREVLARNVERPHLADQDRVAVALLPGWNRLLVKTCVEEGPWTLELRFTDLDGRPLPELVVDSGRLMEPLPQAADPAGAPAADTARTLALAAGTAGAGDVEAARLLALYHLLVHPDDVVDRSARAAAEAALALAPDDVDALYLLARGSEAEGQSSAEMEFNRRLHALKRVIALDPLHVAARLDLAEFSRNDNPVPERVDVLTAEALDVAPYDWRALRARAQWLDGQGRQGEGDKTRRLAEATREASTRTAAAVAGAGRALSAGDPRGAIERLAEALARNAVDGTAHDRLTDLLTDRGEPERALEVSRAFLEAAPFDVDRMLRTADRLEYAGRPEEAALLCERALTVCPESVPALKLRARLDERAGEIDRAAAALAEVVRLQPGDDDARRHRDLLLSGPDRERFELPYRTDALALAGLPMPESTDEPIEALDRTTVWRVHPDGTEHVYEHLVLRVLNQGGVKQLDTYTIPAWGDTDAYVYIVRVIRPDGSFERAPPARGWRFYDLPPLRPGDLVDIEYRLDQMQADVFGEYFGTRHEFYPDLFDGLVPTRRAELVVIAPPDAPIHVAERRAERLQRSESLDADGNTVMRWEARELLRPSMESKMPGRSEIAPVVDLTTFRDWDAFANWWWAFIQKEFVTTPAMREKVRELTAGLGTEAEQVAAIARFVGQEIRYNAWPFGTHGYEPFSAATIFERRFGDCKDKSILLRQMLAEIGVTAVPVLINAEHERADEPLDAAMVGLFNHCIAYLPPTGEREGYYLDATADKNPVEYLRADDQGARVLHVSEAGGALRDIAYAPPEQNALRRVWTVTLDEQGAGTVELADESNGLFGVRMRTRYGGEQGDLPTKLSRELADSFGQVQVRSAQTSDLDDITLPATLRATFTADKLWTSEGVLRTLRTGFDDLGFRGVAAEAEPDRDFDLVLDRPFAHDTTVIWKLPPGAAVERLPRDVDIDAPGLLRYSLRAEAVEGGVAVHRRFELLERRIPKAEYASFRNALREVELAEARTVAVRPGPTGEGR